MRECPRCGEKIESLTRICGFCKYDLGSRSIQSEEQKTPPVQVAVVDAKINVLEEPPITINNFFFHRRKTLTIGIGGMLGLFLFALFVFPTLYRYDTMKTQWGTHPVRTNRITGESEILYADGWRFAHDTPSTPTPTPTLTPTPIQIGYLPPLELAKLQGNATNDPFSGTLNFNIYNGSSWRIKEIVVNVKVFDPNSVTPVIDRDYRIGNQTYTEPLKTDLYSEYVGFDFISANQKLEWGVKSAIGLPN